MSDGCRELMHTWNVDWNTLEDDPTESECLVSHEPDDSGTNQLTEKIGYAVFTQRYDGSR